MIFSLTDLSSRLVVYDRICVKATQVALAAGVFSMCFRDPIRVPRIENRVPRLRENYHPVHRIRENRVPKIREIGSRQIHIGYLTLSLKKTCSSDPWRKLCQYNVNQGQTEEWSKMESCTYCHGLVCLDGVVDGRDACRKQNCTKQKNKQ